MSILTRIALVVFVLSCFITPVLSYYVVGPGMWGKIIVLSGIFVGISQDYPAVKVAGKLVALLLGIVSLFAVLFGLVAATIGGSFKLNANEALLLFMFFMIASSGLIFSKTKKVNNDSKV